MNVFLQQHSVLSLKEQGCIALSSPMPNFFGIKIVFSRPKQFQYLDLDFGMFWKRKNTNLYINLVQLTSNMNNSGTLTISVQVYSSIWSDL